MRVVRAVGGVVASICGPAPSDREGSENATAHKGTPASMRARAGPVDARSNPATRGCEKSAFTIGLWAKSLSVRGGETGAASLAEPMGWRYAAGRRGAGRGIHFGSQTEVADGPKVQHGFPFTE